jgi:hypothetical protein
MPLVRSIARDAMRTRTRFSALVMGVVTSKPFQMNMKVTEPAANHTVDHANRGKGAK